MNSKADKLLVCIGEIAEAFLEETEKAVFKKLDKEFEKNPRRTVKVIGVGMLAAAASFGVGIMALKMYRARRGVRKTA